MKPPRPLPSEPPFLTLYTNTFRRPQALARNMESVCRQTAAESLEQFIVPDHVGYGWPALFGRMSWYAPAVRGSYVAILNDDDKLASDTVVARLQRFVAIKDSPEVVVVRVRKGDLDMPRHPPGVPPVAGEVDLGSYVLRRDVWLRHLGDYGLRYQGDYDHAVVLHAAGYRTEFCDVLFATGPMGGGRPEVDWW